MSHPQIPGLDQRASIDLADLARLDDPCVIFEGEHRDSDGVLAYVYTVGGALDGVPVGGMYGVLVGGDAIVVHASSRLEADTMAADGLLATIDALSDAPQGAAAAGVVADVAPIGRGAH